MHLKSVSFSFNFIQYVYIQASLYHYTQFVHNFDGFINAHNLLNNTIYLRRRITIAPFWTCLTHFWTPSRCNLPHTLPSSDSVQFPPAPRSRDIGYLRSPIPYKRGTRSVMGTRRFAQPGIGTRREIWVSSRTTIVTDIRICSRWEAVRYPHSRRMALT